MSDLDAILNEIGPARSSRIAEVLQQRLGLSPDAARKRLSRRSPEIKSFPIPLLPKREAFLYRRDQRKSERFWTHLLRDLRETHSVYGAALDGLIARGGVVAVSEFPVISGAPLALKKQVSASRVLKTLQDAGAVEETDDVNCGKICLIRLHDLKFPLRSRMRPVQIAESVLLDGVREWTRKMGFGSYNKIVIRGDDHPRMIGQFMFDLTAPSYLLPLRSGKNNGFVGIDVFAEGVLDEYAIQYFIRKIELLRASNTKSGTTLGMLVAQGFTGQALTEGRRAGVVLTTPSTLFGRRIAEALANLLATLNNAAAIAAGNPQRIVGLIEDLMEIEGAAGNLRGVMFELITAYLVRNDGGSVDVGVLATDQETGKSADIDVLRIRKEQVTGFECKGKGPGGEVSLDEVEDWLRRIPIFRSHLARQDRFREALISFELWTTGMFTADALAKLQTEKQRRSKIRIDWKDGTAVADVAKLSREKKIKEALFEHFLHHPLAKAAAQ